jgi:hypothetical protein
MDLTLSTPVKERLTVLWKITRLFITDIPKYQHFRFCVFKAHTCENQDWMYQVADTLI